MARLAFDTELISGKLRFAVALLLASRSRIPAQTSSNRGGTISQSSMADDNRVALLRGCVMEGLFLETNRSTERVLVRNGYDLVEAQRQGCCGALHAHAGQLETARELARRNIDAFLESGCDRVIVNAAGCGAAMKEYGALLAEDSAYQERARQFSSKVRDVSEILTERDIVPPSGPVGLRVAFDSPCHLIHAQRIAEAPIELMKQIPLITVIPLRGSETCCGGAGIYNLQHADLSYEVLRDKLEAIIESGADTIATANPGCIMQIGAGLLLAGSKVTVVHPIELLDAAYAER